MPLPCLEDGPMFVIGVIAGVLGFLPLLLVTISAHRARSKPAVMHGVASLAVSTAFLLVFEAAVWELAPGGMLMATAGMLLGYFAMCGVLVAWSLKHRS